MAKLRLRNRAARQKPQPRLSATRGDHELEGRVAWVTGASGTLGAAIGEALAAGGAIVGLSGRNPAPLETLAARLAATYDSPALVLPMNMASRAQVDAAAASLITQRQRIDILVNCVAVPIFGDFARLAQARNRRRGRSHCLTASAFAIEDLIHGAHLAQPRTVDRPGQDRIDANVMLAVDVGQTFRQEIDRRVNA